MFGSSARSSDLAKWTKLIILNEEMNDIKKIINSLEESQRNNYKKKQRNKKKDLSKCY